MHPKIDAIVQYWRSIFPPNGLPGRQHLDPRAIPALLSNIWMIDVVRFPLRFRFRLLGTSIVDYAGEDNTGKWVDERWPAFNDAPFRQIVESRQLNWWRGSPDLRPERHYYELERVRLPMARDGEMVDMLLCLTVFSDSHGNDIYSRI